MNSSTINSVMALADELCAKADSASTGCWDAERDLSGRATGGTSVEDAQSEKAKAEGKLTETEREKIGEVGSPKREDMPRSVFLKPSERKYPVKEKKDGAWSYDRELLLAAAREARMHGDDDLAREADAIRERNFGSSDQGKDEQ